LLGVILARIAAAADVTRHISGLETHSDLPIPSVWRVVIAAVVTLALAAGTLVLVKRFLPRWSARLSGGALVAGHAIKVLARAPVSRSLTAHLVEVDAHRVLIVEGRSGIELTLLPTVCAGESLPRS
jgi:hypothetical protein